MKHWLSLSLLILPLLLAAQNDTLLFEDFEVDPEPYMLPFPNGNDTVWVDFDEDGEPVSSMLMGAQQNWYSEFGQFKAPNGDTNYVFTSVSYLNNQNAYNHNWLILPPIKLCDDMTSIHWKSAPLEGPAYMDGYYLLLSTTGNDVDDFLDTLFGAAECKKLATSPTSTDPADFEFSPGYIHANTFTDNQYFMFNGLTNLCKLEPHSYFLSNYSGKTVYLAFLHNSLNDNRLDLDDILVLGTKCISPVVETGDFDIEPVLYPNPVDWQLNVLFSLKKGGACRFSVVDGLGETVFEESEKWFPGGRNEWSYWPKNLAAGNYFLKMETETGSVSKPFSKW